MAVKRVTTDEKLSKIAAFFVKEPEIYTLKELEKKLPRECGISPMLLLELLKKTVDENLVHCEKMGGSNIYWQFKDERYHALACEYERAQVGIEMYTEENAAKREHLGNVAESKKASPERLVLREEHSRLREEVSRMERLKYLTENYSKPQYDAKKRELLETIAQINKLTDSIFSLKGYVCNKYGLDRRDFNSNFNLSDEMDFVDGAS